MAWLQKLNDVLQTVGHRNGSTNGTMNGNAPFALDEALQDQVRAIVNHAMSLDGTLQAALVHVESGTYLGTASHNHTVTKQTITPIVEYVRARRRAAEDTATVAEIEDLLITHPGEYHLVRLFDGGTLLLYLVLDRAESSLALARLQLKKIDVQLNMSE